MDQNTCGSRCQLKVTYAQQQSLPRRTPASRDRRRSRRGHAAVLLPRAHRRQPWLSSAPSKWTRRTFSSLQTRRPAQDRTRLRGNCIQVSGQRIFRQCALQAAGLFEQVYALSKLDRDSDAAVKNLTWLQREYPHQSRSENRRRRRSRRSRARLHWPPRPPHRFLPLFLRSSFFVEQSPPSETFPSRLYRGVIGSRSNCRARRHSLASALPIPTALLRFRQASTRHPSPQGFASCARTHQGCARWRTKQGVARVVLELATEPRYSTFPTLRSVPARRRCGVHGVPSRSSSTDRRYHRHTDAGSQTRRQRSAARGVYATSRTAAPAPRPTTQRGLLARPATRHPSLARVHRRRPWRPRSGCPVNGVTKRSCARRRASARKLLRPDARSRR